MTGKLYLVVREDLSFAQQAVQAAHALQEFNVLFPEETSRWYKASNTLVMLRVQNEKTLEELLFQAVQRGFPSAPFHEPDLSNQLTAVTLGSEAKKLVQNLKLVGVPTI